eukprot:jgi/Mesvir1/12949/Mv05963-RA.3
MDPTNCVLAENLVSQAYIRQGGQSLQTRRNQVKYLLAQRRLPPKGWDDHSIEMFLQELSAMDSNNFIGHAGVGEREARVASPLVARRHYNMAHGIGRSGDIAEEQPKAAGSSLLTNLCKLMTADALSVAGFRDVANVSVLPLATGMSLTMLLLALRTKAPPTARYVVWPRMDQKSCIKAVASAGLELMVIPNTLEEDQVRTDLGALEETIDKLGAGSVLCVISTTSCFAPRAPDRVKAIAKLCAAKGIAHLVNNAYGVQTAAVCKEISGAAAAGRVDAVVQSTDKNFMVPVGGAIILDFKHGSGLVSAVNKLYPGRASIGPTLDLFITLLSWGREGFTKMLHDRLLMLVYLRQRMGEVAAAFGCRVLDTPDNHISLAMDISPLLVEPGRLRGNPLNHSPISSVGVAGPASQGPTAAANGRAAVYPVGTTPDSSALRPSKEGREGPGGHVAAEPSSAGCGAGDAATSILHGVDVNAPTSAGEGASGASPARAQQDVATKDWTFLGSMLFSRLVSGLRVVPQGVTQTVSGITFQGFGASHDR